MYKLLILLLLSCTTNTLVVNDKYEGYIPNRIIILPIGSDESNKHTTNVLGLYFMSKGIEVETLQNVVYHKLNNNEFGKLSNIDLLRDVFKIEWIVYFDINTNYIELKIDDIIKGDTILKSIMYNTSLNNLLNYLDNAIFKLKIKDIEIAKCTKDHKFFTDIYNFSWEHKTQDGEWFFFPGKGKSRTLENSYKNAELNAIDYLKKECRIVHRNIQINERCDDKNKGIYYTYVRVAINKKDCLEAKNATGDNILKIQHHYYK